MRLGRHLSWTFFHTPVLHLCSTHQSNKTGHCWQNQCYCLLWPGQINIGKKILYALFGKKKKKNSGLKYASFTAWRSYDRPLTPWTKKGTNRVEICPFSLPSAPLTRKRALRKLPQLHSLPLRRLENTGTAVPANIRTQTSSVQLAAIPHLKAPRYPLISSQRRKKRYGAICRPLNAISRLKRHFTSNASLKHWLHPARADDRTYTVFPLQSSRRLGGERRHQPCAGSQWWDTKPAPRTLYPALRCLGRGARGRTGQGDPRSLLPAVTAAGGQRKLLTPHLPPGFRIPQAPSRQGLLPGGLPHWWFLLHISVFGREPATPRLLPPLWSGESEARERWSPVNCGADTSAYFNFPLRLFFSIADRQAQ